MCNGYARLLSLTGSCTRSFYLFMLAFHRHDTIVSFAHSNSATQGTVAASISPFSIINFSVIFTDTLYVFIFILLSIILSIFSIDMMTKSNDNDIIQRYCSIIRSYVHIHIFSHFYPWKHSNNSHMTIDIW